MHRLRDAEAELLQIFQTSASKHEAHARARRVMEQLARDPSFLAAVLARYLSTPGALEKKNYPVVGMNIALNPWFSLVANCWIPLPDRDTNMSTKAIHHHGNMLLTTATLFGPGYEHWMFTLPAPVSEGSDTYAMELLEAAPHPLHHVAFVNAWTGHAPFYPRSLSITLALWSSFLPTSWRDRVKRLEIFQGREDTLRKVVVRFGLRKQLDLKVVDSFDFYPQPDGFGVTRDRSEFALGPNEDHLHSVFHVVQETGNEQLAGLIRKTLDAVAAPGTRQVAERLVTRLERGQPIEGRLSSGHFGVPTMNFTRDEVRNALKIVSARSESKKGVDNGRQFSAAADGEASSRAGSG